MKTIEVKGVEFKTASAAIQHANASGHGEPITVADKYLVVEQAEADRLARAGVSFAYLCVHELPDGTEQVVTVPVN